MTVKQVVGQLEDARANAIALQDQIGNVADADDIGPQTAGDLADATSQMEEVRDALDNAIRRNGGR